MTPEEVEHLYNSLPSRIRKNVSYYVFQELCGLLSLYSESKDKKYDEKRDSYKDNFVEYGKPCGIRGHAVSTYSVGEWCHDCDCWESSCQCGNK